MSTLSKLLRHSAGPSAGLALAAAYNKLTDAPSRSGNMRALQSVLAGAAMAQPHIRKGLLRTLSGRNVLKSLSSSKAHSTTSELARTITSWAIPTWALGSAHILDNQEPIQARAMEIPWLRRWLEGPELASEIPGKEVALATHNGGVTSVPDYLDPDPRGKHSDDSAMVEARHAIREPKRNMHGGHYHRGLLPASADELRMDTSPTTTPRLNHITPSIAGLSLAGALAGLGVGSLTPKSDSLDSETRKREDRRRMGAIALSTIAGAGLGAYGGSELQ